MKTVAKAFGYASLFLLTSATLMCAAEAPSIPMHFSAYIGGFMGDSYQLELRGDKLTYTTFDSGHRHTRRATINPTAAQWREFRQALDDLRIWQWRANYPN